jgi:peptide deformylase
MPSFPIRTFPDSILRKVSNPVTQIDHSLRSFIDRLIETMRHQPGGIGIAAPQVGILKRIAVVDVSLKVPGTRLLILINPVIISVQDYQINREGCMSLPDYTANIKRAQRLVLKWQDVDFREHEKTVEGLEARCIQHEVDHLNGMLFLDRVGCINSDVFRRKKYF